MNEVVDQGIIQHSTEEFNSEWNGILLSVAPDEGFQHSGPHGAYSDFVKELILEQEIKTLGDLKNLALVIKLSIYSLRNLTLTINGLKDAITATERSFEK